MVMSNQYRSGSLKIRPIETLLVCLYFLQCIIMGSQCKGKIDPTSQTTIYGDSYIPANNQYMYANLTREHLRVSLSINPGKTTRVVLGARRSAIGMFTAGYSVTTIQQLLKEKNVIVMKRSLYCLINDLQANYWAFIICNNKRPYYRLVCVTALSRFSFELEPEFEPIKRHTRSSSSTWRVVLCYSILSATLR